MKIFLNDKFILVLIVINALVIFINGFEFSRGWEFSLFVLDNFITVLFIVELIIKLKHLKGDFFKSNWNLFDFALVLLSIPSLIQLILEVEFGDYSYFLIFRTTRVFKAFRFLKFIPGVNELFNGVGRALKSSVIVLLGFIIYIFILGILSFNLFKDVAPAYYSDPMTSLYSTFKLFTLEGWYEIPDAINLNQSVTTAFFTDLYFIFLITSGGIFGLSLVNSIFVDAMVADNNDELEARMKRIEEKLDKVIDEKS